MNHVIDKKLLDTVAARTADLWRRCCYFAKEIDPAERRRQFSRRVDQALKEYAPASMKHEAKDVHINAVLSMFPAEAAGLMASTINPTLR